MEANELKRGLLQNEIDDVGQPLAPQADFFGVLVLYFEFLRL